jgi:TRAP-type C4-dicarboxylate transport system substrate-binding protein
VTTIAVGGYAPPGSSHSGALAKFRERLAKLSPLVPVEIVGNIMDQGRPAADLLDLVETGRMTMCYFSTSYLTGRVPELALIDTPFRIPNLDGAHAALDGERLLSGMIATSTGFEVLGFWDNGFRHLTNRLRPVRRPEDCVGMRVRIQPSPIHQRMIELWGAIPAPTDLQEGIEMIASGQVDAQENPLANTVAYGVDHHYPHLTLSAHVYGARALLVNGAAFHSWDEQLRDAVREAARAAIAWQRAAAADAEIAIAARLRDEGMEVVNLTHAERDAFAETLEPLRHEIDRSLPRELLSVST